MAVRDRSLRLTVMLLAWCLIAFAPVARAVPFPLYELYSEASTDYFYTIDPVQRQIARDNGFVDLGAIAWVEQDPVAGAAAFRRFYRGQPQTDHFYTVDAYEAGLVYVWGWTPEGNEGHLWLSGSALTVPLYRFSWYNAATGDHAHRYTASDTRRQQLLDQGWRYDGIAGYVLPGPAFDAKVVSQQVPTGGKAGDKLTGSITIKNNGLYPWTKGDKLRLESIDETGNRMSSFGWVALPLDTPWQPGENRTVSIEIIMPSTGPDLVHWEWTLTNNNRTRFWFGERAPATKIPRNGTPVTQEYDTEVISQTVPTEVKGGAQFTATISLKNIGTKEWTKDDKLQLESLNEAGTGMSSFGFVTLALDKAWAVGETRDVTLTLTMPTADPVDVHFQWQLTRNATSRQTIGKPTPSRKIKRL